MTIIRRPTIWNIALVVVLLALAGLSTAFRLDVDPAALEAKYAGGPSRFVEADGIRFHIRDRGQGPVLVLLHGQAANFTVWEDAAVRLAADHRVISVDLPGHGLTGPDPQERYRPVQLAAGLDALMTALGVTRFALAGNSMGGGVANEYALAHPDRLSALILVDAVGAPRGDDAGSSVFSLETMPVIGPLVERFTPQALVRASLADTFGDPSRLTDAEVTATYELMLRAGNRDAERQIILGVLDDADLSARIPSIATPTLILWGSDDRWILPRNADWFAAHIPGAVVHIFEGVGHMPMLEAPEETADTITLFLAANRA